MQEPDDRGVGRLLARCQAGEDGPHDVVGDAIALREVGANPVGDALHARVVGELHLPFEFAEFGIVVAHEFCTMFPLGRIVSGHERPQVVDRDAGRGVPALDVNLPLCGMTPPKMFFDAGTHKRRLLADILQ